MQMLLRGGGVLVALVFGACSSGPVTTHDAGVDTSCGVDCTAQAAYGLVADRCFEYSSDPQAKQDPPALGVRVLPVFTLDNSVKVMPVEYRRGGQLLMRDSFTIKNGDLYLVRREFPAGGQSVTYRDSQMTLAGAQWLEQQPATGQTFTSAVKAVVVNSAGAADTNDSTYRVTTAAPSTSELRTPLGTFADGVKLIFSESPTDHGSDSRRVYAPGVGFLLIASPYSLTPGSTTPVMLQRIRDLGTPDAGPEDCSLGRP